MPVYPHHMLVMPQYPELVAKVAPIVKATCEAINKAAAETKSEMPYKSQFILEAVIRELQSRV